MNTFSNISLTRVSTLLRRCKPKGGPNSLINFLGFLLQRGPNATARYMDSKFALWCRFANFSSNIVCISYALSRDADINQRSSCAMFRLQTARTALNSLDLSAVMKKWLGADWHMTRGKIEAWRWSYCCSLCSKTFPCLKRKIKREWKHLVFILFALI